MTDITDIIDTNVDTDADIEYRGYTISTRYVTNNTEGGLRYTRYVILKGGQPTDAAALSLRAARNIIDTMICRDRITAELAEKVQAAAIARTVPEVREYISNARKLGRRDLSVHDLI